LVEAVINADRSALFPLFHSDPLVAPLPRQKARALFDAMVAATESLLPAGLKGAA
jgi:alpha-galactosidase